MSQTIDIRIYLERAESTVGSVLSQIADAVADWDCTEGLWQGVRVAQYSFQDVVEHESAPLELSTLKTLVTKRPVQNDEWVTSGISFKCWRFRDTQPEPGFLRLGAEAWGCKTQRIMQGEFWVEGNARLTISRAGPYWAIVGDGTLPGKNECNSRVKENIESILQLVFQLAAHLRPASIKVFVDAGEYIPLNAHVIYYRDLKQVIADVLAIANVWSAGIPKYETAAIASHADRGHNWALSELRNPELQQALWDNLAGCIRSAPEVTEEAVSQVLASNEFDVYGLSKGFVLLNHPFCFNAFLDGFFVRVLETAK